MYYFHSPGELSMKVASLASEGDGELAGRPLTGIAKRVPKVVLLVPCLAPQPCHKLKRAAPENGGFPRVSEGTHLWQKRAPRGPLCGT